LKAHAEDGIKVKNKAIRAYYDELKNYKQRHISHETAVRSAFQNLLANTAKSHKWMLVPELSDKVAGKIIRPDGTIRDNFNMPRGYWEAKDSTDDLDTEIYKKIRAGYPTTNIIFEDTKEGVLYQDGVERLRIKLDEPKPLEDLINLFFGYRQPNIEQFEKAIDKFGERVPDLAKGLLGKINEAHTNNGNFINAFAAFFKLCQNSLNPNIREAAVDEMLVQHLLTERLIRTIFNNPEFAKRNIIANEVEKVIAALVSKSFDRNQFLKSLDMFYLAIEDAARGLDSFTEKQHFLNTVYERFFQGYSVEVADTHGIIYTPQPIVDFMCRSIEEALKNEFKLNLGGSNVNILDPCTGTGNFIANIIRRLSKRDLPRMYSHQLFANEVMLMPYYIASLNIEHAYFEKTNSYEPFEGICFVDTLDLIETKRAEHDDFFMTKENAERVQKQRKAPITVIIGNPPYNVGQLNENDNNKNRQYKIIEKRIKESYSHDSKATNKNQLNDPYVKFFRWASDRLNNRNGLVCFISNNSFVDRIAFDGMRKHLHKDFNTIYHIDLHGNVRKNPKLSGTTHNVFGIQVGVGITIAIRNSENAKHQLFYYRVPDDWRKEEKLAWLVEKQHIDSIEWKNIKPDLDNNWVVIKGQASFGKFMPLGSRIFKAGRLVDARSIFKLYSMGVKSNRDDVVYDFKLDILKSRIEEFIEIYNREVDRYYRKRKEKPGVIDIDEFVNYEKIKWSETLKKNLREGTPAIYDENKIRIALFRPFSKRYLYFDSLLNERRYQFHKILPIAKSEAENKIISVPGLGSMKPFQVLIVSRIPNLDMLEKTQCFPYYIYDTDGTNRRENITSWSLEQFRAKYKNDQIKKWDIFYYIYGLLHHPGYREKFGDCLKRELPRIPFAPEFDAFSEAGKKLAKLHLNYEQIEPYDLKFIESEDFPLSYRVVDKMRLDKNKTSIVVNPSLTLAGIPKGVFDYQLGNRSALEWVIDQYQVKKHERSGVSSDPNNPDDEQYIVRLLGQVIALSLETMKIVNSLPKSFGG
jgi:predicted helicase